MIRDRRWGVLGPLLVGLVLLLSRGVAQDRTTSGAGTPGVDAAGLEARAVDAAEVSGPRGAKVSSSRVEDIGSASATGEPRHPEVGFRDRERLIEHFHKHGREFGVRRPEEYLRLAQLLRDRPKDESVLVFVRNDAVTCKFDRASGAFLAYNSDGTLRTFFRPNDGETYFERQKSRDRAR